MISSVYVRIGFVEVIGVFFFFKIGDWFVL